MKNILSKILLPLIAFILFLAVWGFIEWGVNAWTKRFEPLNKDSKKQTLFLNQKYFEDFFLHKSKDFFITSASNRAIYAEKKSKFRIFCLGGSTTAGYPYNTFPQFQCPVSFANYLRTVLQYNPEIPDLEVLNAGCNALNSTNVLYLFKDLLAYKPDLVVVYTGHNEYFGPNEFLLSREKAALYQNRQYYQAFMHLRQTFLYQGLRAIINKLLFFRKEKAMDVAQWSRDNAIPMDHDMNRQALETYRQNLEELIRLAKKEHIAILLCTTVSNWTFPPFISQHSQAHSTDTLADSLDAQARNLFNNKQYPEALNIWTDLVAKDSSYANNFYHLGMAQTRAGQYPQAAHSLQGAIDADALPFRSKSFLNYAVRDLARKQDILLADTEAFFIQLSQKGIPEPSLMLDHVHPTEAGYYYMAIFMAKTLVENGIFANTRTIQYPSLDACRQVLGITPQKVAQIEADFVSESYVAKMVSLNPEIGAFMDKIRKRSAAASAAKPN